MEKKTAVGLFQISFIPSVNKILEFEIVHAMMHVVYRPGVHKLWVLPHQEGREKVKRIITIFFIVQSIVM